ncbi:hypothetical protein FOA52_003339 [Chlamydomonas sp. UWO 241]|nr:hypothetical protein FOA52_003339 [Chlamydomonas sp. UWO 241]
MVKGKQKKDKTIRVQPITSFFGGTPGGAVKCIVRRRTGAPTKVVQHPDVDDVEPGLDVESEAECEGEEGERLCATSGDGDGPSDQPPRADTPLTDAWMAEEERVAAERVAERAAAERAASGVGAGTSGDQPPPPRAGTSKKTAGMGDTFRHIWLERDWTKTKDGKVWLEEVKGDPFHAFCNLCSKYMNAKSSTVTEHSKTGTKHQSRDVRSIEVAAAAAQPPEAVQQHFAHDAWSNEGKRTLLQMRVLLNLMQHGRPMTAYEQEKAVFKSAAVFDVLSDREEAQHQALWPAFLAAKVAGKRAQFHRARLVVDGKRFFISMFAVLMFVKIMHWLVQDRVDYVEVTPNVSALQHLRLIALM